MKKFLSLLLVITLVVVLMAGCGQSSSTEPEESEEQVSTEDTNGSAEESNEFKEIEYPQVGSTENAKIVKQMPEKPLRFVFLGFQNNPFWALVQEGVKSATEYLKNYNVTIDNVNLGDTLDAKTVNAGLETAIAQGYDGIVVTPFAPGTETYIDKAVDAGIPVVTLYGESEVPSKRFLFSGQDTYAAGQKAGKIIKEYIGHEGGKYAIITGQFTVVPHENRRKGAEDVLAEQGNIELVGTFEAMDSADRTYNYAKDIITAHSDIKALFMTAGGPFGAAKAVEDMEKTGEILVVGYDEVPENLEYVRKGQMTVIGQNPAGVSFDGFIHLYNKVVANQDPPSDFIPAYSPIITPENVDELFPK